jgi:hypothetical protein
MDSHCCGLTNSVVRGRSLQLFELLLIHGWVLEGGKKSGRVVV